MITDNKNISQILDDYLSRPMFSDNSEDWTIGEYIYEKRQVANDLYHWHPIYKSKTIVPVIKYIYAPLCNWLVSIDFCDKSNYVVYVNLSKTHKDISFSMKKKCLYLFDFVHKNIVLTFDVDKIFDFSNDDESNYIYNIVNLMLSVFSKDNWIRSIEIAKERNVLRYSRKNGRYDPNSNIFNVLSIFHYHRDIALVYVMNYCIYRLSTVELLVAMFYFDKYNLMKTGITKEDVEYFIKTQENKFESDIEEFKKSLYNLYGSYIEKFSNDIEKYQRDIYKALYIK